MKRLAYVLFVISLVIFLFSIISFFVYNKALDSYDFYTNVNVTLERGGFDLNNTALTFGMVALKGSSTRDLVLNNSYSFPVIISLEAEGEIEQFLSFQKFTIVEPNEEISIPISIIIPGNTVLGMYEGNIKAEIKRA